MYFNHTHPLLPPFQLHILLYTHINTVYIHMVIEPSTGHDQLPGTTYIKKKKKRLSLPQQPSTVGSSSSRGEGSCAPPPPMLDCRLVWSCGVFCRQPQLLWVHKSKNPVVSRWHWFSSVLPKLWLLWPFCPFFHDIPWPLVGGGVIEVSHVWPSTTQTLGSLTSYECLLTTVI